ncbi:sec-independent protein translocase protein TatB [Altererythrobacter atlanticus]|uniref:Sec-independent protein translocase protein TatB n=1 Tax=Croceibacterium atlanticum TaxID=1267766 RepID=A0A0F7KUH3_9SPHN|nr:Sec-independent protein translocase protein TatB [Croceibacterium atlanticum]AKH42425.1 Sec-independent protein translocase protein TatB [Croceibacterium atlanticum]MBB5731202.1 sec-independent protein translocase protein TatB [Croceibacterium atlanticum]
MFDIGATELLLIVIVAVIVIGPKDMPLALRTAGRWIGKVRRVSSQFRAGFDAMVREAEMEEMEKKWREQNEKVMREHPQGAPAEMEPTGALPPPSPPSPAPQPAKPAASADSRKATPPAEGKADEPQLPLDNSPRSS